jgi:hypothetical protein
MSQMERPDRLHPEHEVTIDDVLQLMGASTPHFALQIRNRLRNLIKDLREDHPARLLGEQEIHRLELLAARGESFRGDGDEEELPPLPSIAPPEAPEDEARNGGAPAH